VDSVNRIIPLLRRSGRRLFVASVLLIPASLVHARMSRQGGQQASPQSTGTDSLQTQLHMLTDVQRQEQGIDKKEFADYKVFYNENQEPAKKIQLGKAFLQKYPKSTLAEAVDAGLVNAYIAREDWADVYTTAETALALKPDDVDVLIMVGWVIPHEYQPADPNADALLSRAESYEKHAIEILATIPKPDRLTDAQFAAVKTQKSLQAHSGLGLVYFRRGDYSNSANELHEAVENNPSPDPTDLYVLGIDLQNLKRTNEAADIFGRCAAMPGSLQDRCKGNADQMKKVKSQ
jgi:tetratricopeptide (TPR) repeat protein